jgi:hypothetical protein
VKVISEFDQFLKLISPEAKEKIFGEKSNEKV